MKENIEVGESITIVGNTSHHKIPIGTVCDVVNTDFGTFAVKYDGFTWHLSDKDFELVDVPKKEAIQLPKDAIVPEKVDMGVITTTKVGVKYDSGKLQWRLIPWMALREIVEILTFGAKKYSPGNWKKVEHWRYKDALMRHLTDWYAGEKCDKESGKSHLAHAGCCLLFLLWFELNGGVKDEDEK